MKRLSAKLIIKILEDHKVEIKKHGVKKIGLFGSYVRGKAGKKSDLDFLVVFEKNTFDHYMDLKFFLEKLFKRKVDLVVEDSLKPAIEHVKEEALYAKAI